MSSTNKVLSSNSEVQLATSKNTIYDFDLTVLEPNASLQVVIYDIEGSEIGTWTLSDNSQLIGENVNAGKIVLSDANTYNVNFFLNSKRVTNFNCATYSSHIRLIKNTNQIMFNGEYIDTRQIRNLTSSDKPNRSWTLTEQINTDLFNAGDYFKTGDAVAPIEISKTTNSGGDLAITETGSQIAISSTTLVVRHIQFVNAGSNIMYIGVGNANVPLYPNWIWLWDANPDEQTDLADWTTKGTSGDILNINYQY